MAEWQMTAHDREYLRNLAKRQAELAALPIMKEREADWYKHNDLIGGRPMITFETWTCEQDLLPPLQCTSDVARQIELQLVRAVLSHDLIGDDKVVPSFFGVGWHAWMVLFDTRVDRVHAEDSSGGQLGHQFVHPIKDLAKDLEHLKPTVHSFDKEATLRWKAFLHDVMGDILPIKITMGSLSASLSQHAVHLMGMENMMFSMVDCPDEFIRFMSMITDAYIDHWEWLENNELLVPNSGNDWLGQGSYGFTKSLPQAFDGTAGKVEVEGKDKVKVNQVWGYMDSQETVGISPAMFGEFFFPSYEKAAQRLGLLSYGCCEPVHSIWTDYIGKLSNLRKVSISAWCDEQFMGEALAGSKTIFHRKPSPMFIGVGKELDEVAYRQHILATLTAAKNCKLEFSFRDIYNLGGDPEKPRRAVQIIRELVDKHWGSVV